MSASELAEQHLPRLGTLHGVREALGHMQAVLGASRSDAQGLWKGARVMMLRPDLDQECYDFVKWLAMRGDTTLLYRLNIRQADILDDPGFPLSSCRALNLSCAVLQRCSSTVVT